MTYEDFEKFVRGQCMYETIYDDSDGRPILVIRLLDAYGMVNKAAALAEPEQQRSEQWWRHEVSNAYANGYEKGRASVKQPEQEPVAWIYSHKGQKSVSMNYVAGVRAIPLYTAPPQREWQGLTDEEIDETAWPYFIGNIMPSVKIIVRQLEAKLKEKNGG